MPKKTYYEILGVSQTATQDEIKKAYHKLSRQWHPNFYATETEEKQLQADKMMKIINEANDVLSNPSKRYDYDIKLRSQVSFSSSSNFSTTKDYRENYSYTDANKEAGFDFDEELKEILKMAIAEYGKKASFSITDKLMIMAILTLCASKEFLTQEELELIVQLRKILSAAGIVNSTDFNNSFTDGDKKFRFKY